MEESSVKTHRLADTTFRVSYGANHIKHTDTLSLQNNEELSADLHRLATAAKTYYKAMQGEGFCY